MVSVDAAYVILSARNPRALITARLFPPLIAYLVLIPCVHVGVDWHSVLTWMAQQQNVVCHATECSSFPFAEYGSMTNEIDYR